MRGCRSTPTSPCPPALIPPARSNCTRPLQPWHPPAGPPAPLSSLELIRAETVSSVIIVLLIESNETVNAKRSFSRVEHTQPIFQVHPKTLTRTQEALPTWRQQCLLQRRNLQIQNLLLRRPKTSSWTFMLRKCLKCKQRLKPQQFPKRSISTRVSSMPTVYL